MTNPHGCDLLRRIRTFRAPSARCPYPSRGATTALPILNLSSFASRRSLASFRFRHRDSTTVQHLTTRCYFYHPLPPYTPSNRGPTPHLPLNTSQLSSVSRESALLLLPRLHPGLTPALLQLSPPSPPTSLQQPTKQQAMVLGRLTHYALDLVLVSAVVAGVKRSTGFQ